MNRDYQIVKKDRQGLDAVKFPTILEIAWAAGIYEGEGSCVKSGTKGTSFTVIISQKDPELLYRMRDLFGGGLRQYNVGEGRRFMCYHWTLCGDKARVFLASIYPYLTSRRKSQVDATTAGQFIESVSDIVHPISISEECEVFKLLWARIDNRVAEQREKAAEHKRQREREWRAIKSQDPAYVESKRLAQQQRRKIQKEKLQAETLKIVSIAS